MTKLHAWIFSLALTAAAEAGAAAAVPAYTPSRQDEDWSALRDPAQRKDFFNAWKYIPLAADPSVWLSTGGEWRERYEYFSNANWGRGLQDSNGYLLQRFLFHTDVHVGDDFRFFAELQSGFENGRNGGPRATDRDQLDAHQLFIDFRLAASVAAPLVVRLGRQELAFGTQRLVALRDSPNLRRTFDGFRATWRSREWRVDGFVTRPVRLKPGTFDDDADPATTFWGVYGVAPFPSLNGSRVDLYYLGLKRDTATFAQGIGREERHSLGARLWGKRSGWDWNHEIVYQFGTFGPGRISAWTVASDTGYTFADVLWKPRVGLKADATSGDRDPHNPNLQTFNPLFPKGGYFAETGLIGPQNHVDVHPSLELHPVGSVTFTTDVDYFWRESANDGIYNIGLNVTRAGLRGGSSYIGAQATAQLEWRINRHLTWTGNYAHFFAGAFLEENPPAKDVDYVSTWISFRL